MHQEMLIDGHLIGGPCDQSVGKELVRNPVDGSVVGTVAEGGWSELRTAISAAHDAYSTWRFSTIETRQTLLNRIADLITERREELAELLVIEIGKPITLALAEVDRTAITFRIAADELNRWSEESIDLSRDPRAKDYQATVSRVPIGVIFAITPYNWPFNLAAHKIAPALATGNTVILKPSPLGALCSLTLARLIHEAGAPPGTINSWNGPVPLVKKACADPRVKVISFTGSVPVGWQIKAENPQKVVLLELGGDAFAIVDEDADLDFAADRIAFGAFAYAGQICISVQHVLVHQSILPVFREKLVERVRAMTLRDPNDSATICGPMISPAAAEKVEAWIQEALHAGATRLIGADRDGSYLAPTVIEGQPSGANIWTEEVFGPVVTLSSFDDFQQAIDRANDSKHGIHVGVFTQHPVHIQKAKQLLDYGGIVLNDIPTVRFDAMPYGGEKQSGFGREGVRYSMEEFTTPKGVVERLHLPMRPQS